MGTKRGIMWQGHIERDLKAGLKYHGEPALSYTYFVSQFIHLPLIFAHFPALEAVWV